MVEIIFLTQINVVIQVISIHSNAEIVGDGPYVIYYEFELSSTNRELCPSNESMIILHRHYCTILPVMVLVGKHDGAPFRSWITKQHGNVTA